MNNNAGTPAARSDRPKVVIERSYRARVDELWDLWTTKKGFVMVGAGGLPRRGPRH